MRNPESNAIRFVSTDEQSIDQIRLLWEKLYELHRHLSTYFSDRFPEIDFEKRKAHLFNKSEDLKIRLDLAYNSDRLVGYCLSSVMVRTVGNLGEIESLYVEPEYRGMNIGDWFMRHAIEWLNTNEAKRIVLGVAVGNEEVHRFYQKYDFYPRTTILEWRR